MPSSLVKLAVAGIAAVALAGPAIAWDEIVAQRGWAQVDYTEDGDCRAEVRGNGQFYRIAGAGLRPGEVVSFRLANSDVRPVEYRIVAERWRVAASTCRPGPSDGGRSGGSASASCRRTWRAPESPPRDRSPHRARKGGASRC